MLLLRDAKRLVLVVGLFLIVLYVYVNIYGDTTIIGEKVSSWIEPALSGAYFHNELHSPHKESHTHIIDSHSAEHKGSKVSNSSPDGAQGTSSSPVKDDEGNTKTHREVFSLSTKGGKYFPIDFNDMNGMNPNIIPHPTMNDTWIVVAQKRGEGKSPRFAQLVCNASFKNGALKCLDRPNILPIAATRGGNCEGDLNYINVNHGPHDARVFFGPESPFTIYGSNSFFTCFGQFVQDFRLLIQDWEFDMSQLSDFRIGTELQRPPPWGTIEKNWFLFWDPDGQMYAHYDVMPRRSFAEIKADGSTGGGDLAIFAADSDEKCLERYMPKLAPDLESIHQSTNSLQITMCKRQDPSCVPDEGNTFIFTIFQHKTFYHFHSVYEPYAMVFRQRAPFKIHGMARKPVWIHGRESHPDEATSDMFYVTSMSWKTHGQKYHGYLDDELFLAFGIEDDRAGGIDILAGDLLDDLGLCDGL